MSLLKKKICEYGQLHLTNTVNMENYLGIYALEDGLYFTILNSSSEISYSIDSGATWEVLNSNTNSRSINTGEIILVKGNLTPKNDSGIGSFYISKQCKLQGNCNSLLFGDNAGDIDSLNGYDYAFYGLFSGCSNIIEVSENFLPATTLSIGCYYSMFEDCTNLTTAPELPAMTLANNCYSYMFQGCTNLTTAPELPATTLAIYCYEYMFANCSSLTVAPELPATALASDCYEYMFANCSSLTTAPELPATALTIYCYSSMFDGCTNLTTAPELPATTLAIYCYEYMFANCSSLTVAPELPATALTSGCYQNMFDGCSSLTSAPELPATTLASSCYSAMFRGCARLTTAPELPATTLAIYCYEYMFANCSSLTVAPELPATALTTGCYRSMFQGCIRLTTTPQLPATTLADNCYNSMFYACTLLKHAPQILSATILPDYCYYSMFFGCSNLTKAPVILATTLGNRCCESMFEECGSLTNAPELPATTLGNYCYSRMFAHCTSLVKTPSVLPATTLAEGCYGAMFAACVNITTSPELPAFNLVPYCYDIMFYGCNSLNYVKALFMTEPIDLYTDDWLKNVSTSGKFLKNVNASWDVRGVDGIPTEWVINYGFQDIDSVTVDNNKYLTFYALQDDFTVSFRRTSTVSTVAYSTDSGTTWTTGTTTLIVTPAVNAGQTIMFKGGGFTPTALNGIGYFTTNNACHLLGNCNSMLFGDNAADNFDLTGYDYAFHGLFSGCTTIVEVSENFLPATILSTGCYGSMFRKCSYLITAPALPATTLVSKCYEYMFYSSRNLSYIKALFTTLDTACTSQWVNGVNSVGTFVMSPHASWYEEGYNVIPIGWTVITTDEESTNKNGEYLTLYALEDNFQVGNNLTSRLMYSLDEGYTWANLEKGAYTPTVNSGQTIMFKGSLTPTSSNGIGSFRIEKRCKLRGNCMSLLFGDNAADIDSLNGYDYAFFSLFSRCTTIMEVSKNFLPATTLASSCYQHMFNGCSNLTSAPELPAMTLANNCYSYMFQGCTNLTTAPELPATTLTDGCYYYMFYGCSSLTSAPELPATALTTGCYVNMFYGCTSLSYIKMLGLTNLNSGSLNGWVGNVATSGTFVKNSNTSWNQVGPSGIPSGWTVITDIQETNRKRYLTIYPLANGVTIKFSGNTISYSLNEGQSWTNLASNTTTPSLNSGQTIMFKAQLTPSSTNGIGRFIINGPCKLQGNCNSLLFGDNALEYNDISSLNYAFANLFSGCTYITEVSDDFLTATTVGPFAYYRMFLNCTGLTAAPELPATVIGASCYNGMFQACNSLTKAPSILPARLLVSQCYGYMFQGCSNLTTAPELPATTLVSNCYNSMFQGCAKLNYIKAMFTTTPNSTYTYNWVASVGSSGTFVKNKNASWSVTGANGIPSGWTVVTE